MFDRWDIQYIIIVSPFARLDHMESISIGQFLTRLRCDHAVGMHGSACDPNSPNAMWKLGLRTRNRRPVDFLNWIVIKYA
jgi:hypothetical protein